MRRCPLCEGLGEVVIHHEAKETRHAAEWIGVKVPCFGCLGIGQVDDDTSSRMSEDGFAEAQLELLKRARSPEVTLPR